MGWNGGCDEGEKKERRDEWNGMVCIIGLDGMHNRITNLDGKELIDIRITGKQRLSITKFAENAADRPHIHSFSIRRRQNKFWGTVPPGGNVCGVNAWPWERTRKTKVAELEHVVRGDKQILWFDVAMDNVVFMTPEDEKRARREEICKSRRKFNDS